MTLVAASSLPSEGICCSISHGITSSLMKFPLEGQRASDPASMSFRCKIPFFGSSQCSWLSLARDLCPSKVCVAADYSDSVPDSSSHTSKQGYHPLEELKVCRNNRQTKLSYAEIARTTVEANRNALLVFPGMVHREPHEDISWAEFQYLIDDYGDIYFGICDDANILKDRGASNPVNVLIGMDIPVFNNRRTGDEYDILYIGSDDEFLLSDDNVEWISKVQVASPSWCKQDVESSVSNSPVNWGMPDTPGLVHPIFFAKCLSRAVNMECDKRMTHPSNGVSIVGCLRPASPNEESYLRMVFHSEDGDGYNSDWKDSEVSGSNSMSSGRDAGATIYRLETLGIELYSIYGCQHEISLQDFQDAEPDILVHSTSAILERFNEQYDDALKALCKKKGLDVEGASLIGVDSLGMDVRICSGAEVKTHRFPFKVPATSEIAAEKQIHQLLFPRSRRKKCATSWRRS